MPFNEKAMQSLWTKYVKSHKSRWKDTRIWELKITKTNRLNLKRIEPHQLVALDEAQNGSGSYHKISDMSLNCKPWDCQLIKGVKSYIVVLFYEPRQSKLYYVININDIMKLINGGTKSITRDMAQEIAEEIIKL